MGLDLPIEWLELVDRLQMRPLLDGVRGQRPADVSALARAISRLSGTAPELSRSEALLLSRVKGEATNLAPS